jgi:hypothetical protein
LSQPSILEVSAERIRDQVRTDHFLPRQGRFSHLQDLITQRSAGAEHLPQREACNWGESPLCSIHPGQVRSMFQVLPSLERGRHSILGLSVLADHGKLVHLGEPALAEAQCERARTPILREAGKVPGFFLVVQE